MSSAVPWSGATRGNGRPSVTFTPFPNPATFTAVMPTSWYGVSTASNSPLRARTNTVSAGGGRAAPPGRAGGGRTPPLSPADPPTASAVGAEGAPAGCRGVGGAGDPPPRPRPPPPPQRAPQGRAPPPPPPAGSPGGGRGTRGAGGQRR